LPEEGIDAEATSPEQGAAGGLMVREPRASSTARRCCRCPSINPLEQGARDVQGRDRTEVRRPSSQARVRQGLRELLRLIYSSP
jgi:hypothetical protein